MKRFITLLLVSLSAVLLIACSNQSSNSLDGEYYWINESRNEIAFTISGNKGTINKGEADAFTIDKDNSTIELTGSNIISRKESYTFKDGVFTVDISGTKQDYYKKDSEAYKEAWRNMVISKTPKLFVILYIIKTLWLKRFFVPLRDNLFFSAFQAIFWSFEEINIVFE